jgi:hypothetical protein
VEKEKTFIFIYEDKDGNELQRKELDCYNRDDAEKTAFNIQQNSMLNDLENIRVQFKPIKWARKCSKTGEGMDEGWHFEETGEYFAHEEDALEAVKRVGWGSLQDAYDNDTMFWTTWHDELPEYEEDENGILTYIGEL